MAISGRYCRSERAIVKRHAPPICHCEERSDVAISGRHPRSVLAAVKTVLAPRFVIARSEATWQSREGTPDPYRPPLKQCWPPDLSVRGAKRRGALSAKREEVPLGCNLGEALPFSTNHRKNGTHLRFVIARSEATWRPEREARGSALGVQSRESIPDPYRPPLKQCWPPDLSLRGGRRPTWQSRSTRSDNRKASANSTPRKAVKA